MSKTEAIPQTILYKVWIAFRFIAFGVGGFLLLLYSSLDLIGPGKNGRWLLTAFLTMPLVAVGALMMLFGAGVWRRWGYVWVFLSFSMGVGLLTLAASRDKGNGALLMVAPPILSYLVVRGYYRRRDARERAAKEFDALVKPKDMTHP